MEESGVLSAYLREAKASQLHKFPKEPRNQSFRGLSYQEFHAHKRSTCKVANFFLQLFLDSLTKVKEWATEKVCRISFAKKIFQKNIQRGEKQNFMRKSRNFVKYT